MPNAISTNDRARPEQDSAVIALNARSEAIIEIVFIGHPPLLAREPGIEGQTHKAKIFTADCPTLLTDYHREAGKLAVGRAGPVL